MMMRLLGEMKNCAVHKERLLKAHHFIGKSRLLLQLVTAYEMTYRIIPDSATQDRTQIGKNEKK